MSDEFSAALDQQLRDAITSATGGTLAVTRWILAYEITDGDSRVIRSATSENNTLQDMAGMLRWVTIETDRAIEGLIRRWFPMDGEES